MSRERSGALPIYQYKALPSPRSYLGSGEFEGIICTTDLDQFDRLPYFALSYTWQQLDIKDDDVEQPVAPAILINERRLAIGSNFFEFLKHIMASRH